MIYGPGRQKPLRRNCIVNRNKNNCYASHNLRKREFQITKFVFIIYFLLTADLSVCLKIKLN